MPQKGQKEGPKRGQKGSKTILLPTFDQENRIFEVLISRKWVLRRVFLGPKMVKSTTELGQRAEGGLEKDFWSHQNPYWPNRENGSCGRALERVKRTYIMKYWA